ncbi:MAG: MBL fold metallo-hydrolase [bacterium]
MKTNSLFLFTILFMFFGLNVFAQTGTDSLTTDKGTLKITYQGWSSVLIEFNNKVIYVDPAFVTNDYLSGPKADFIFITHSHYENLNMGILRKIVQKGTNIIANKECAEILNNDIEGAKITTTVNNKTYTINGLKFNTVPAYNMAGEKIYHKKGDNNGFIFEFGNVKVFIAGDTENIPELKELKNIDIAFLPICRPYAMDADMFVDLVNSFKPKIVYPYHYDKKELEKLKKLFEGITDVELRVR